MTQFSDMFDFPQDAALVTPHDTNALPRGAGILHISVAGALRVKTVGGTDITIPNVPVGIFPLRVSQVFNTGTAATGIVWLGDKA